MATQDHNLQFFPLSPLDNIMPRVYIRIILCIQTGKYADPSAIAELLSKGLRKTVEQVPFLDGEIVPYTTNPDRLGRLAVRVSQPGRLHLKSKNLAKQPTNKAEDCDWKWSLKDLAQENWLPGRFNGTILSPVEAFTDPDENLAVMAAQATFIEGGVLLCAAIHHNVVDGTGAGTIIRLWAQNCREIENAEADLSKKVGQKIENVTHFVAKSDTDGILNVARELAIKNPAAPSSPAIEISPEALDRTRLIPSRSEDKNETSARSRPHPEYNLEPSSTAPSMKPVSTGAATQMERKIFYFSTEALAALKDAAKNAAKSEGPVGGGFHGDAQPVPWISTNDALSALIWICITRARNCQDGDGAAVAVTVDQESKLRMANNGRRRLDPPMAESFLGNVALYSLAALPVSSLISEVALPNVARSVRASVNHVDDEHIRSSVWLIDSLPHISKLAPGFAPFLGVDLVITSWADLGLNGLDWGHAVGQVERVRLPVLNFDGLCIVLPRTKEGALEVLVGLDEKAMNRLEKDEFFMRFAQVGGFR